MLEKSPLGKEIQLSYSSIQSQIKFLQGKVLTVVDASLQNEKQLKAVKDLINKMFSEQLTWVSQLCFPDLKMWSKEQVVESGMDVDSIEGKVDTDEKNVVGAIV